MHRDLRAACASLAFVVTPAILLACGSGSGGGTGGSGTGGSSSSSSSTSSSGTTSSSTSSSSSGTTSSSSSSSSTTSSSGMVSDHCPGFLGSCNVPSAYQCTDYDGTDSASLKSACEGANGTWSATDHCPNPGVSPETDIAYGCVVTDPGSPCHTQWYYKPLNQPSSGSFICMGANHMLVMP